MSSFDVTPLKQGLKKTALELAFANLDAKLLKEQGSYRIFEPQAESKQTINVTALTASRSKDESSNRQVVITGDNEHVETESTV